MNSIQKSNSRYPGLVNALAPSEDALLYREAFEHSLEANIICSVAGGKIIKVNNAACRLLGYSKRELTGMTECDVFDMEEPSGKKMRRERRLAKQAMAFVTGIRKDGKRVPCKAYSATFPDAKGIKRMTIQIADISESLIRRKEIDMENERVVAEDIIIAKTKQKAIDVENEKIVADNIGIAKTKQKKIDLKNAKLVAYNIVLAKSKQRGIDLKNQRLVKENILLAKLLQSGIDVKNEKLRVKQLSEALEDARSNERSDIGRELHDNVNQLLGAAKMYLDMGKRGGKDSETYLHRSSEYTITAIEEIRKLTKGLTSDIIKNLGLRHALETIAHDTSETTGLHIICRLSDFTELSMNNKFKLSVFRIVQEQMNNILKHAKAKEVMITIKQDKNSISLSIADDGVGFDINKVHEGIGLENIKSRASEYNGAARFFSEPGHGCLLAVTFHCCEYEK